MTKTIRSADFRLTARQILQAKNRPQTEPWEDWVTMALSVVTLFAVFWDGWLHNNSTKIDSFWSSAHIMMYAGLTGLGAFIGLVFVKRQPRGKKLNISLEAVPYGYGLALVALPLAALGGPGDFIWHAIYGFENQIDAPFSPTHQMLFLAGGLLGGIGLASTWHRAGRNVGMKVLWPAIVSATAVLAMVSFTFMNLLPWFWTMIPTQDFQDNLLTFKDAYSPGTPGEEVVHPQGLYDAAINYSGDVFPYYLFSNMASIGGILIWTAAYTATVLYLRRRWVLPFGSITLLTTILAVLFPFFTRFQHVEFIFTLIVVGLLTDALSQVLLKDDPPSRLQVRAFGALLPLLIWGPWLLAIALFEGGVGWHPTMWTGVLTTSMGVGFGIALIMFPPALPAPEEGEVEVA